MSLSEIAKRNYAQRQQQISKLLPVAREARQKAKLFDAARDGAKDLRQTFEMVQSLKHVPGFFPTPKAVVDEMMPLLRLESGLTLLEPSAGKGDLALAAQKAGAKVLCIELNYTLCQHLWKIGLNAINRDFLETTQPGLMSIPLPNFDGQYDRVAMNPPFERSADLKHIQHAFEFLKPGGLLVSVASNMTGEKLRSWADDNHGWIQQLPAGSFATSDRPTGVNTCLVIAERR